MGKKSKNKGDNFERKVAKILAEWWGTKLKRTPLSGGWGTEITKGDVVPVDKENNFPFCVEVKANECFSPWHLFLEEIPGYLLEWWGQANADPDKPPLLVVKNNHRSPLALFPVYIIDEEVDLSFPILLRKVEGISVIITNLSDLTNLSKKAIKEGSLV